MWKMKRRARHAAKSIRNKFSDLKSATTNLLERSTSQYDYPRNTPRITSTISSRSSDSGDDDNDVFGAVPEDDLQTDDVRRASVTLIPCEFCFVQQPSENLDRHQRGCAQNPLHTRRARHLRAHNATTSPRHRAASDNVTTGTIVPTAPPRSRSPSPTEGYTAPSVLICPITQSVFHDPVVASDGHTYERSAITNWLQSNQVSPITRGKISINTLNANRAIKKMSEDFREECQRKRLLYKYKLDVDVKKLEEISYLKTPTKTFYLAEWVKDQADASKIILVHLSGERAEKIGKINCQVGLHPNIVQTFGRIEDKEPNNFLVQEYLPGQTLSQLLKHIDKQLSLTIFDTIMYQIVSALEYLADQDISHGSIKADNVFIYNFDENPENISVKITNIAEIDSSKEDDVYAFGLLAQELYSSKLSSNDAELIERQNLINHCLTTNPNERPIFNDLTKTFLNFLSPKKFIYPPLHE